MILLVWKVGGEKELSSFHQAQPVLTRGHFHIYEAAGLSWGSLGKKKKKKRINQKLATFPHCTFLFSSSASWSIGCITSPEEDLHKATAVTEQTKALISRKPLPLPVVLERREEKRSERGKSDSATQLLFSLWRLKWRDEAQGEIIFRASPISRVIEERKWCMSLGGLGSSHKGRSMQLLAKGLAPWTDV